VLAGASGSIRFFKFGISLAVVVNFVGDVLTGNLGNIHVLMILD
jgi:hypothetical protein